MNVIKESRIEEARVARLRLRNIINNICISYSFTGLMLEVAEK
jgi:hypothetical protein